MKALTVRFESQLIRFALPAGEVRIGSAHSNDIALPFPGVSRVHARLTPTPGGAVLTDLGSKNRLMVNGSRTDRVELGPGVTVYLGHAMLTIEEASTGDLAAAYPIATGVSRESRELRTETHTRGIVSGGRRSAAALAFVRDVEQLSQRAVRRGLQSLLATARDVLGAECVFLFERPKHGEIALTATAGMPDDALLDAVSAGARPQRDGVRVITRRSGRKTVGIAALFPRRPSAWETDFLEYLSLKLTGVEGDASAPVPPAASLTIPEGMVIGTSGAMAALLEEIRATVRSRLDVLLLGETGTGKELIAQLIHASGPTSNGPFVAINCAAIPTELLEAELFGVHGRVATGVDPRIGRFTQAEGGTIFLDEIGELTDILQAKLLRVLQEREVLPLGAKTPRTINVRVIAASNRDLVARAGEGKFRADLYYRLRGLELHLPPLRERKEDIVPLAISFASRAARNYGKNVRGLSRRAMELLLSHSWPGNVRELQAEIARAVLTCADGSVLQCDHFASLRVSSASARASESVNADLQSQIDAVERQAIEAALHATNGNKTLAAKLLGITRNGLALKMVRLKLG